MRNFLKKFVVTLAVLIWGFSGWPQVNVSRGPFSIEFSSKINVAHAAITASSTTYTTAGTFTYIVSTNACQQIIDVWGGGGAGFSGSNSGGGAGGGGGALASSTTAFSVGSSHTLVVGDGGTTSGAGGATSTVDTTVIVAASGGGGGGATTPVGLGALASLSTGTTKNSGGNGAAGRNGTGGGATDEGGGGGGAAGPHGDGLAGTPGSSGAGGDGGTGDNFLGGAGATANGGTGGSNANGGGGGGGALNASIGGPGGAPGAGGGGGEGGQGNGAAGQIKITELVNDAGCVSAPTVTTDAATGVTVNSANLNGNITATGGANSTVRGFAWGTNSALSGGDTSTTTESGSFGTGTFSQNLLNLLSNKIYYFRAYATNSAGTGYGSITSFTTTTDTTVSRKMRLFEGFTIKFISGRIILHQK